jgi:hypothetical protein
MNVLLQHSDLMHPTLTKLAAPTLGHHMVPQPLDVISP